MGFADQQEQEPAGEEENLRIILIDLEEMLRENMVVPADHHLIHKPLVVDHPLA